MASRMGVAGAGLIVTVGAVDVGLTGVDVGVTGVTVVTGPLLVVTSLGSETVSGSGVPLLLEVQPTSATAAATPAAISRIRDRMSDQPENGLTLIKVTLTRLPVGVSYSTVSPSA